MRRISGPVMTHRIDLGWLRAPMSPKADHIVGDRLVPSPIEVDFPGADGQPALEMLIEVLDGVPRCTELTIKRTEGGREVRQKDLRAVELDSWVEIFVALCSAEIVSRDREQLVATYHSGDQDQLDAGIRAIAKARKGSRRPMTDARKQRVADTYNGRDTGGIEAVQRAFDVSRATAIRYINAAREAGLIEKRTK